MIISRGQRRSRRDDTCPSPRRTAAEVDPADENKRARIIPGRAAIRGAFRSAISSRASVPRSHWGRPMSEAHWRGRALLRSGACLPFRSGKIWLWSEVRKRVELTLAANVMTARLHTARPAEVHRPPHWAQRPSHWVVDHEAPTTPSHVVGLLVDGAKMGACTSGVCFLT